MRRRWVAVGGPDGGAGDGVRRLGQSMAKP